MTTYNEQTNTVHMSYEELRGLVADAAEILDLPPVMNFTLAVDQTDDSPVRVAAYRLTNCVGGYDSGRTLGNLEPRWAWKRASDGKWVVNTPGVGPFGSEAEARAWIASAPVVETDVPSLGNVEVRSIRVGNVTELPSDGVSGRRLTNSPVTTDWNWSRPETRLQANGRTMRYARENRLTTRWTCWGRDPNGRETTVPRAESEDFARIWVASAHEIPNGVTAPSWPCPRPRGVPLTREGWTDRNCYTRGNRRVRREGGRMWIMETRVHDDAPWCFHSRAMRTRAVRWVDSASPGATPPPASPRPSTVIANNGVHDRGDFLTNAPDGVTWH